LQKVCAEWPSKRDCIFLEIAYASMAEVLCQLDISESLGYITQEELHKAEEIADRLARVMSGLRKSLNDKISNNE
jgi:four helix bundle protein